MKKVFLSGVGVKSSALFPEIDAFITWYSFNDALFSGISERKAANKAFVAGFRARFGVIWCYWC